VSYVYKVLQVISAKLTEMRECSIFRHALLNSFLLKSGLCVLLRRMAYPNRLCDLKITFKRKENILSMIVNTMVCFIIREHGHLLETMAHWWMTDQELSKFSAAVHEQGAPLTNCVGFVDGK